LSRLCPLIPRDAILMRDLSVHLKIGFEANWQLSLCRQQIANWWKNR